MSVDKPIGLKYCPYAILWKCEDITKEIDEQKWKRVSYDSITGEYQENLYGDYLLYKQFSEEENQFPSKCPQCEIEYRANDIFTPLKRHSTGLQKVNQVLADALVRIMKNSHEANTKVVLFLIVVKLLLNYLLV